MKLQRYIATAVLAFAGIFAAYAQEVQVTVTPARNVLPPQVMYYLSNPGQYFNMTIQNISNETQLLYFGLELRQLTPSADIEIIVPGKTIPQQPIEVGPGKTRVLNAAEMRNLFNHVRYEDVIMPANLFDNVASSGFGNIPEGTYRMNLVAYKWDPRLTSPVVVNNPLLSQCTFTVCYQAKAPEWISPVSVGDYESRDIATLPKQTPMLQWTMPMVNCDPRPRNYTYDIKIVQQLPLQAPDQAMDRNPIVYQTTGLTMPQCMLPVNVVNNLAPTVTYVAEVTARSNSTQIGSLDYISIQNDGKSQLLLFRIKDYMELSSEKVEYSMPEITTPRLEPGAKFARMDTEMNMIQWNAPKADKASGIPVSFSYDVRIVKPTEAYDIRTHEGRREAMDNITPLYEKRGVRSTSVVMMQSELNRLPIDSDVVLLLEVSAHADTVPGAYKTMTFENDGRSRVMAVVPNTMVISRPKFINPAPFSSYDNRVPENLSGLCEVVTGNTEIRWQPCEVVSSDGTPAPEILYDLKIVKPDKNILLTADDIQDALDELEPVAVFNSHGANSFYFHQGGFNLFDPNAVYLVQVKARLKNPADAKKNPVFLYGGKSLPALVLFRTEVDKTLYSAPKLVKPEAFIDMQAKRYATVDISAPTVQWTAPERTGNTANELAFTYNLKIVKPNNEYERDVDGICEAAEELPPVYEAKGIATTTHTIPRSVIASLDTADMYVMRVCAIPDAEKYDKEKFRLSNDGKSAPAVIAFKNLGEDGEIIGFGNISLTDSLYNFANPEIILPRYLPDEGARKEFLNSDIAVKWNRPTFEGGAGAQPDTIQFVYDVELFAAKDYISREEMLKTVPIYANKALKAQTDTIRWDKLDGKVEKGDYLMLRVKPTAVNDKSVAFLNDSINIVDFAMSEVFSSRYFQCANQVEITNERPTTLKAADLKGKRVQVGEYELYLDGTLKDIQGKPGHFSGTGHVAWKPLAFTWKLAVKFDDIAINTDNQVFSGMVVTHGGEAGPKMSSAEVVDKLFSDWGIDNLIGDSGIPYANMLQGKANDKIKGLAEQIDLAGYYNDIIRGKAKVAGLLKGNLEDVTFPVEIPDEINNTPVNLQITTMKFAPTYATMDLIGTFVVPETKATKNQILVFGAPRMCISPSSLIPEGGTVALLKDFTVNDPSTDYDITFKAPQDVIEPGNNGCFVSWSQNKFEMLNLEMEMTLPNLKKVGKDGKATDEHPKMHLNANIKQRDWAFLAKGNIDAFEHEDLPGYVFTANDLVVDYSNIENDPTMPKSFPKGYKPEDAGIKGNDLNTWKGLYFKELSMQFPKAIKIGNGKERMKLSLTDMYIDKSGMTLCAGIDNAIKYEAGKNGSIGGFGFDLDKIFVNVVQNRFDKFGFDGSMQIPLLKGKIMYECRIRNLSFDVPSGGSSAKTAGKKGYAYTFRTFQMEGLSFDFMLAKLNFNEDMTYFLVEAMEDETGELKTNCELRIGGSVSIGGKFLDKGVEKVNNALAKLPIDISLPEIKFCKFRIANNKSFESVYYRDLQTKADKAEQKMLTSVKNSRYGRWFNEAKDLEFGSDNKLYLNLGQWGFASPSKTIGPFTFELRGWDFDLSSDNLAISVIGAIEFNKDLNVDAETTLVFNSTVKNLASITDISLEYKNVEFKKAKLDVSVPGFSMKGFLEVANNDKNGKGYSGGVDVEIAGGLFKCGVKGGYYSVGDENSKKRFSWGFLDIQVGGKCGIPIPPMTIDNIHGGLYFNCRPNRQDPTSPTPDGEKKPIGIIVGMGLSTIDKVTFSGEMETTVVVDRNKNGKGKPGLSTFMFNGNVKCMEGIINSKVSMIYENTDTDRYFQLNITADASLTGPAKSVMAKVNELAKEVQGLSDKIQELNDKFEGVISDVKAGLQDALGGGDESSSRFKKNQDNYDKKKGEAVKAEAMGLTISLDIRIQSKKDGKDHVPPLWHVYLGQPEESQRCKFVLVDYKGKLVTVSAGANAYLCVGSELPNNGQLPPLPAVVEKFLNGGDGKLKEIKGQNKSDADNARNRTIRNVMENAKISGGVMVGASVWAYIDVNLGLLYGGMGATAGFDLSIVKLSGTSSCVNLGGKYPGYKGWYGSGQLYAYLYAKFGFYVVIPKLITKKIDLIDAGLGGVLRARMPNPNYFEGKVRAKLRLLGGLVNINRTFTFECGDVCELFQGNALDNFNLFEDCTIGYESMDDAAKAPAIDYILTETPVIRTKASMYEAYNMLDPTAHAHLIDNSVGDTKDGHDISSMANRKFFFGIGNGSENGTDLKSGQNGEEVFSVFTKLTEYNSEEAMRKGISSGNWCYGTNCNDDAVKVNLQQLNPGKFYRLSITGYAKEYRNGGWHNPETYVAGKGYVPASWVQTKDYYFSTKSEIKSYPDTTSLQPFVKLAFPSDLDTQAGRMVIMSDSVISAPLVDIQRPMISLDRPLKGKIYNNGKLTWYRNDVDGKDNRGGKDSGMGSGKGSGKVVNRPTVDRVDNLWIENDSVSVMMPSKAFRGGTTGKSNIILRYEWKETIPSGGRWDVVDNYTIYADMKVAAENEADRDIKDRIAKGTLKGPRNKVRYRVTQLESVQAAAGQSGKPYQVEILVHYAAGTVLEKEMDIINLVVQPIPEDKARPGILYNTDYYGKRFMATRMDSINFSDKIDFSGYASSGNSDYLLYNTEKPMSDPKKDGNKYVLAKNPFVYLSYMGNVFFVGGYPIVDEKFLNINVTTSESLTLTTPFGKWTGLTDGKANSGPKGTDKIFYNVYNGIRPISNVAFLTSTAKTASGRTLQSMGTMYPLYSEAGEDPVIGGYANGVISTHPLDEQSYLKQIKDFYYLTQDLSKHVAVDAAIRAQSSYKIDAEINYLNLNKGKFNELTRGNYSIIWPRYQNAVLFASCYNKVFYYQKKPWIYTLDLIIGDKSYKINGRTIGLHHPRIKDQGLANKLLYLSFKGDSQVLYPNSSTGIMAPSKPNGFLNTNIEFDASSSLKDIASIDFMRYRINAWDFNKRHWTIFQDDNTRVTNDYFTQKYTFNNPFNGGKSPMTDQAVNVSVSPGTSSGGSGGGASFGGRTPSGGAATGSGKTSLTVGSNGCKYFTTPDGRTLELDCPKIGVGDKTVGGDEPKTFDPSAPRTLPSTGGTGTSTSGGDEPKTVTPGSLKPTLPSTGGSGTSTGSGKSVIPGLRPGSRTSGTISRGSSTDSTSGSSASNDSTTVNPPRRGTPLPSGGKSSTSSGTSASGSTSTNTSGKGSTGTSGSSTSAGSSTSSGGSASSGNTKAQPPRRGNPLTGSSSGSSSTAGKGKTGSGSSGSAANPPKKGTGTSSGSSSSSKGSKKGNFPTRKTR